MQHQVGLAVPSITECLQLHKRKSVYFRRILSSYASNGAPSLSLIQPAPERSMQLWVGRAAACMPCMGGS